MYPPFPYTLLFLSECREIWLRFRRLRHPRRRRLYLRRRNRKDREPRGQEGPAAPETAVPGGRGALWLSDDGEQCRKHRGRPDDPAPRRAVVRKLRARE